MSNKIDGSPPQQPAAGGDRIRRSAGITALTTATPAPAGDSVRLTSNGRLLQQASALIDTAPAVDRGRVETVKQAIANGSYRVDSARIAQQIQRLERFLTGGA